MTMVYLRMSFSNILANQQMYTLVRSQFSVIVWFSLKKKRRGHVEKHPSAVVLLCSCNIVYGNKMTFGLQTQWGGRQLSTDGFIMQLLMSSDFVDLFSCQEY